MTETREIYLPSGHVALIDEKDWPRVKPYKWRATGRGNRYNLTRYVHAQIMQPEGKRRWVLLHRLITGAPRGFDVDHINHDGFDNRRSNLRICTRAQNCGNQLRRRNNTVGYAGVTWDESACRWAAQISPKTDGATRRNIHLGYFKDPWEAAQAYNAAALAAWGEFAPPPNERHPEISRLTLARMAAAQARPDREPGHLPRMISTNTSGYKGVCRVGDVWRAYIHDEASHTQRHLGHFNSPEEAAHAYNVAARAAFGDAAYLNDVPSAPIEPRKPRPSNSGYKGVNWHKSAWRAYIAVGGKQRHLGSFTDPWEAALAYNVAARAAWGESAYQNERLPEDAESAA